MVIKGSPHHGRLEISGAFRLNNGKLVSQINSKLILRDDN